MERYLAEQQGVSNGEGEQQTADACNEPCASSGAGEEENGAADTSCGPRFLTTICPELGFSLPHAAMCFLQTPACISFDGAIALTTLASLTGAASAWVAGQCEA